ncbi:MAG: RecQ family ATP-dependent DNA helicase [Chloroflexota bacterium]|nr:RecQ family ATP-dependent DNA helicase [Chloroflexota bacterium]
MAEDLQSKGLTVLRRALADPAAAFRDGQWDAIERLVRGRERLLVVQRTGWGKSVVYFLSTRLLRDEGAGPTLLISPLLSLMRNQIQMAERMGIRATTINSSNRGEWADVTAAITRDEVDVLLVSPERLANDAFREEVLLPATARLGLFVVDEAHCISDWGHDFRPDYLRITRVLQAVPRTVPVLTTTATANDRVVEDVVAQLGHGITVSRGSLMRESLQLQTIQLPGQAERMAWLAAHVPTMWGSGVIYALTIADAQRLAEWLQLRGIDAHAYWGGLDPEQRVDLEQRLLGNELKALVATTALGMGFDKPDLGFVIHYQRPGSVVHYYQQVGRAGRAVASAYGILLSGAEDAEITNYFIETAFPPEGHVDEVLAALHTAEDGLSAPQIERDINLSRSQIEKVLKLLAVRAPAPVAKEGARWYATAIPYAPDTEKVAHLTAIRRAEQARMQEYVEARECLMLFLARELDDANPAPCGRCAVCRGGPLISEAYPLSLVEQATQFLRRSDRPIQPRRQWSYNVFRGDGAGGGIPADLRAETGRSLCIWGDAGWGELVRTGKHGGWFDEVLVAATVAMIRERWRPAPGPAWVTCVPSLTHPALVPDLAGRIAEALSLSFVPCILKVRDTEPQKEMQNSYQQAHNLAGAFTVAPEQVRPEPVLLVDDMVDSRWTFTVTAALLRAAGSGPVYPLALCETTRTGG